MQRSVLHLFPYENFVPHCPKLEGAKPGYIGKFKSSPTPYLLKVENDRRPLLTSRDADEHAALESLSSQLIRAIFGKEYAADIHLIEIGGSKTKPKWIGNNANIKIKVNSHYGVLSVWEEHCRPLTSDTDFSKNLIRIRTIAALINMDDYKPSNIVKRPDGSLFLVDCAGDFSGFTRLNSHDANNNLKMLKKFIEFNENDLINIIAEYRDIICHDSKELLIENIRKTREKCKELVHSKFKENEFTLFGKRKPSDKAKAPLLSSGLVL